MLLLCFLATDNECLNFASIVCYRETTLLDTIILFISIEKPALWPQTY